ncbi:MAG: hypothetical protein RR275_02915 [Lachnospiraceae bacterium]
MEQLYNYWFANIKEISNQKKKIIHDELGNIKELYEMNINDALKRFHLTEKEQISMNKKKLGI